MQEKKCAPTTHLKVELLT